MNEKDNLLAVLIEAGVGSRRKLADAIMHGKVTVNGEKVSNLRHPINKGKDKIVVNGEAIGILDEKYVYLMLNKPEGIVSTVHDDQGRKTVIGFIPQKYRDLRLYPVGRLDKDSSGLLLLTNDGELTNRLTHPRYGHEKEYLIRVSGKPKPEEIKKLEAGVMLRDGKTAPAKIKEIPNLKGFNHSITLHEGRKRQIRRMFLEIGYRVLALKRVRIGKLNLGELPEGRVREISADDIKKLFGN